MAGIVLTDIIVVNYVQPDRNHSVHFLTEIDFDVTDYHRIISPDASLILTSKFNAWYLKNVYKATTKSLQGVEVGTSYTVKHLGQQFSFCFFYSKSSTGSVALFLNGDFGVYLYTGNFCYYNDVASTICPEMKQVISIQSLTRLYFDATYYEQKSDFMGYDELLDKIAELVINGYRQTVYIMIDSQGLEGLLVDVLLLVREIIPDALFHVNWKRFELISVLGYDHLFTTNEKHARVYVRSSSFVKKQHLDEDYELIFIRRASKFCQTFNSYEINSGSHLFTFYAHSSHERCCTLINLFKPESLIPTSLAVDKCGIKFRDFTNKETLIVRDMPSKKRRLTTSASSSSLPSSAIYLQDPGCSNRVLKTVKTLNKEDLLLNKFGQLKTRISPKKIPSISKKKIPNVIGNISENQRNKFVKLINQDNILGNTSIHTSTMKHRFRNSSIYRSRKHIALTERDDRSVHVKLSYNIQVNLFKQLLLAEINTNRNCFKFNLLNNTKSINPSAKLRLLLNPKIIRKLFLHSVKNGQVFLKPSHESVTYRRVYRSETEQPTVVHTNESLSTGMQNTLISVQNKPLIQAHVKENDSSLKSVLKINSEDCLIDKPSTSASVTLNNTEITNEASSALVIDCSVISNKPDLTSLPTLREMFRNRVKPPEKNIPVLAIVENEIQLKNVPQSCCGSEMLKVNGLLKVKLDRNVEESSNDNYDSDKRQSLGRIPSAEDEQFIGFDDSVIEQDRVNYRIFTKFLLRISKLKKYRS
ncbi:hypothetical protein O3M35_001333 [Rhynocoris fuscipes]|uniref:Uncharacterized protein n=1 Tax=Rhynocoris fuscipes TaxID=488301 RepID=A0AAW1DRR4_9HEMI